jgi:hypothetical protein
MPAQAASSSQHPPPDPFAFADLACLEAFDVVAVACCFVAGFFVGLSPCPKARKTVNTLSMSTNPILFLTWEFSRKGDKIL